MLRHYRKLKEEIKHDENIIKQRSDFIPRCEELLDNYWSLDTESKNKMLKSLIEKVVYSKDTKNAYGKGNEIGFQLDIFPKSRRIINDILYELTNWRIDVISN